MLYDNNKAMVSSNHIFWSSSGDFCTCKLRNPIDANVPAIVLGGSQNALSVARNLSRVNIDVSAINYPYEAIRFSRYARYVSLGGGDPTAWQRFLLSNESNYLRGAILLACSDEAINIICSNYDVLKNKFLLEETSSATRYELLDKFVMYRRAEEAGIPTVRCWLVNSRDTLEMLISEFKFPLVAKPVYSPQSRALKVKATVVLNLDSLIKLHNLASQRNINIVLMDHIPGGDDRLCSYFTYLDEVGNPLAHLTKRVKRRYPEHGDGTYHYTEWIPEAAALGLRFFRHLNYKGLGNIEFKWDERDGRLKMIEANGRFAASDCLLTRSGVNLALIAYNRILNRPQQPVLEYKKNLVLCRPIEDASAAWRLYRRGELRLSDWVHEVWSTNLFPFFEWRDPIPALVVLVHRCWKMGTTLLSRVNLACTFWKRAAQT